MGFAEYLRLIIKPGAPLLEAEQTQVKPVVDYDKVKAQIEGKIGGDTADKVAVDTSFEAIEQALDLIPLEYLEDSNNTHLSDIFDLLIDKERINFLDKFTEEKKKSCEEIVKTMMTLDRGRDEATFIKLMQQYAVISERLLKIYRLLSGQAGEINEAKNIDPDLKAKLSKIIKTSKEGASSGLDKILDMERKNIDSIPENEEGEEVLFRYKDLFPSAVF